MDIARKLKKRHNLNVDIEDSLTHWDERKQEKDVEFNRVNINNKRKRMFKSSLVGDTDDLKSTFEQFKTGTPNQKDELNQAKNIANRIYQGEQGNFLFTGKPGLGKTMLAVSILNGLNSLEKGYSCFFLSFELFMELKKSSFNDKFGTLRDDVYKIERCIQNCDVLVIDDLGSETSFESDGDIQTGSKFTQETLFRIADYRKNKVNIITTNNTGSELQDMYHPKIISRLLAKTAENTIRFEGTDQRRN